MSDDQPLQSIHDVVDFYTKWPELRPRIEAITKGETITPNDIVILEWLIRIADMVGPIDLETAAGTRPDER